MSGKTKVLLSICCIVFFAGGIFTYFSFFSNNSSNFISDIINKVSPNKGSIAKDTISIKCNGKDVICMQKDRKIISEKQQTKEKACEKTKDCHLVYSANERAAITAIRAYTGVPDMNLNPLVKNSSPNNITYYCNDSSNCWAVDHVTHKVIERI